MCERRFAFVDVQHGDAGSVNAHFARRAVDASRPAITVRRAPMRTKRATPRPRAWQSRWWR